MISCRADEVDTTLGFTDLPFNTSYYHLHKPYDLPETQRYSFAGGVHRLWVYATDKPYRRGSPTKPRTELMISGYVYNSGIWQIEGQAFVPNGTNGACILQVFGGSGEVGHRTTLMLRVYNGSLTYYRSPVLVPSIFDRWFRVNVIHHVAAALLEVYVDGVLLTTHPRSEIKIQGYTYSSGIWQFEGQGYVPKGTNGVCIMQVFGATRRATSLMLRVYNGSLMYYQRAVIVPEIFDRWFRLNVIHDVEAAALEVYVDGVLLLVVADHGGKSHYFKFGVYGQNNMSDCMESRWKGIRVLYKNVT
ncbi:unnamed protein product [Linum tenue]|uniref:Alginate lyase 2 domain-containing protein n=1 Tax=Linum tenue TaxID=586396 RepID=A0AAV0LPN5_9ROSI|nr:unnamed protein product [Linum tenue]